MQYSLSDMMKVSLASVWNQGDEGYLNPHAARLLPEE
jgi:hypothetical protein